MMRNRPRLHLLPRERLGHQVPEDQMTFYKRSLGHANADLQLGNEPRDQIDPIETLPWIVS